MIDIIKPYPGEDQVSFAKRKAYFYRFLQPRFDGGIIRFNSLIKKSIPLDTHERDVIDSFWAQYLPMPLREQIVNYRYYDCYKGLKSPGNELFKYIPDTFFKTFVDEYFSNPQHSNPCDDKNMYDLYFHDIDRPKTLFRKMKNLYFDSSFNEITLNKVLRIAKDQPEIICKIAKFSSSGKGILIWNSAQDNESELVDFLQSTDYVICQEMFKQHAEISRLNPTSVNTLRLFTLLFQNEIHVLSAIVRMGRNASRVDNASKGGIVCGINSDGTLKDVAWTVHGEKFETHPLGFAFDSVTVPNYHECIDLVKSLAKRMSAISRMISWDLAINETGHPVFIECNFTYTGTESLQIPNGPLLGDLTDDVLKELFANSYTLKSIIKSYEK